MGGGGCSKAFCLGSYGKGEVKYWNCPLKNIIKHISMFVKDKYTSYWELIHVGLNIYYRHEG